MHIRYMGSEEKAVIDLIFSSVLFVIVFIRSCFNLKLRISQELLYFLAHSNTFLVCIQS